VEAVEYFCFHFQHLLKCHVSEFASASTFLGFLLPLPAPDKVGRFRVRFRFQLILPKRRILLPPASELILLLPASDSSVF